MINTIADKKIIIALQRILVIFLISFQTILAASGEFKEHFPVPNNLRLRVQFWINVFTRYSKYQYVIHDIQKPERIYRVVDIRDYIRNRKIADSEKEIIKANIEEIELILKKLASGKFSPDSLNQEERRIYRLFGKPSQTLIFKQAINYIRYQQGMKEKFRQGIERSKSYIHAFKKIFREEGVPEHLIYLAHVESSFNPRAESKYGALGIWQFTRATGRMYLTINSKVDERKNPYLSCRAAAKLLKRNYELLGSWPLAVTAYNHGLYGVKRAMKKSGSSEIDKIIENYSSRLFGFASKNFYAEFIAVLYIMERSEQT